MLQQRSAEKPLWPGYWSNTCCSHPRRGESYGVATQRRLHEELGIETPLGLRIAFDIKRSLISMGQSMSFARYMSVILTGRQHPTPGKSATGSGFTLLS